MVIELIGGVGAGKSRILEILETEYGARVIQTDLVARTLEEKGREGYRWILEHFGPEILGPDGELDKTAMAKRLFSDKETARAVNEAIHPMVWRQVKEDVKEARREGVNLLVVESAIPYENPGDIYDEVWYVYTLKETRIMRLMEKRGYSRQKALAIMENQPSEAEYEAMADRILFNSGSFEEVSRQVAEAVKALFQKEELK